MNILVFTEGTVLMHSDAKGKTREEIVWQSKNFRMRRIFKALARKVLANFGTDPGGIGDYRSYIPIGNAVEKIRKWKNQGATIFYLSSRRVERELTAIRNVLQKYDFPDFQNLLYRQPGDNYKDVAEKLMPDLLIEDDCESIGGEVEMTYPHIGEHLKPKIKSIVVKEFGGIDHLSNNINQL